MPRLFYTTLFIFGCICLHAQQSIEFVQSAEPVITEKTIFYNLAGNIVPIKITRYGENTDVVFINLHDDETTSVEAAKRVLEEFGGLLIEIENNHKEIFVSSWTGIFLKSILTRSFPKKE